MHVLIATDGALDAAVAAEFATRLCGSDGRVTVMTVIEINRNMLRDLRGIYGEQNSPRIDTDVEYVGRVSGGTGVSRAWPGDDEMLGRYLEQQSELRTAAMVTALAELGITAEVLAIEGEDAAGEIIKAVAHIDADMVFVGSHGRGLFDGVLGSVGTKVARRSPRPVLVLRSK